MSNVVVTIVRKWRDPEYAGKSSVINQNIITYKKFSKSTNNTTNKAHNELKLLQGGNTANEEYYHLTGPELANVRKIPSKATASEIVNGVMDGDKYVSVPALRILRCSTYNGKRSDYPQYVFPTAVIFDNNILDDTEIIEP